MAELPQRRSVRIPGYDYAQPGAYFITLVTWQRKNIFGSICDQIMELNMFGLCVSAMLNVMQKKITIDTSIVMPNHIHAIIVIRGYCEKLTYGNPYGSLDEENLSHEKFLHGTKAGSIGAIVQKYKSITTEKINRIRKTPGAKVWQRNYYEHIVRDEKDWENIRDYILENPRNWAKDDENIS